MPEVESVDRSLRLYLAIKKVLAKEGWDYYSIQGVPGIGDDYVGVNFVQSLMLEARVATTTLCDFNTLMTVILLNDFSEEPVYYGDVQHVDKSNNEIKIITGSVPPRWLAKSDRQDVLNAVCRQKVMREGYP